MRLLIIIIAVFVYSNSFCQEFGLKIGMSIDDVFASMNGKYTFADTVDSDSRDPEGNYRIDKVRFVAVDLKGLKGILIVNVDKKARVTKIIWVRMADVWLEPRLGHTIYPYNSPRRELLKSATDSMRDDCKIADFKKIVSELIPSYGKGKEATTDESLHYRWSKGNILHFVMLKEGQLWYYYGKEK